VRSLPLLDEFTDKLRNLIRGCVECEMTAIDNLDLSVGHIPAVGFGLRGVERRFIHIED